MSERQASSLWLPTNEREVHFDVPRLGVLEEEWQHRNPNRTLIELDGAIYGVAERPDTIPKAIVSLDLREVVRETGLALLEMRGGTLDDMVADGTTGEMDYGSTLNGWHNDIAQPNRQLYIQEFMHHDMVRPVKYRGAIRALMQKWRDENVYVIANTSTLPGCELSTIRFLNEHYPDCFRGILLPRNHDGKGKVTKAMALQATTAAIQYNLQASDTNIPTFAIDDAMHHATDLDTVGTTVLVPAYAWNTGFDNHATIHRIAQNLIRLSLLTKRCPLLK